MAGLLLAMALAMAAASAPEAWAQAAHARLGSPKTLSFLGQPLQVVIPIQMQPGAELPDARWALGTRPGQSGMPYLERARLTVEQTAEGLALVIRSYTPVHEPAIGLVIQEFAGAGAISREFAVLLDPPPLAPETVDAPVAILSGAGSAGATAARQARPAGGAPTAQSAETSLAVPPPIVASPVAPIPTKEGKQSPRSPRKAVVSVAPAAGTTSPNAMARPSGPAPRASARESTGGPRLVLSLDSGLSVRKEASEEERAALRVRQMLLYLDDLTAAINERQNKIAQLEKELAGLHQLAALREELDSISLRVKSAELDARKGDVSVAPGSRTQPDRPSAPQTESVSTAENISTKAAATPATTEAPAAKPAERAAPAEKSMTGALAHVMGLWSNWWPALLLALGFASVVLFAGMRRRQHQLSDPPGMGDEHFLWSAEEPGPDVEVPEEEGVRAQPGPAAVRRTGMGDFQGETGGSPAAGSKAAASPWQATGADAFAAQLPAQPLGTANAGSFSAERTQQMPQFELPADRSVQDESRAGGGPIQEGSGARRLRYLRIRYADIAAMNPALDQPARVLHQAGQAYGEGAVEHAKRLLKFAAYSRPETEVFWLALLELLYRERWTNEYSVTAHWFHQWCPESIEWNEVLRLGYMLNPGDSRFQVAAHWSKVEPAAGLWLPVAAAATITLPHLDLQLVNE